jgi:hypothetical protein
MFLMALQQSVIHAQLNLFTVSQPFLKGVETQTRHSLQNIRQKLRISSRNMNKYFGKVKCWSQKCIPSLVDYNPCHAGGFFFQLGTVLD